MRGRHPARDEERLTMAENENIEVAVVNAANSEVGKVTLPEPFGAKVVDDVMFEQVLAQLASRRSGSAATKTRGEIRGGGKKPWKQKGTGRARAGSIRSPIWRGGGTTFGPRPRSYAYRLPKQARLTALRSALAQKARDNEVRVVDKFEFSEPKTKQMREVLAALGVEKSALIVLAERDGAVELSARNLPHVLVTTVEGLNVYDILRHRNLLISQDALAKIEERLSR
jgi:large subunit ribosomal protein L4